MAFLVVASGLDAHGCASDHPLPYTHVDIAGRHGRARREGGGGLMCVSPAQCRNGRRWGGDRDGRAGARAVRARDGGGVISRCAAERGRFLRHAKSSNAFVRTSESVPRSSAAARLLTAQRNRGADRLAVF